MFVKEERRLGSQNPRKRFFFFSLLSFSLTAPEAGLRAGVKAGVGRGLGLGLALRPSPKAALGPLDPGGARAGAIAGLGGGGGSSLVMYL